MLFSCDLPLMRCVLVKTASGATGNESDSREEEVVFSWSGIKAKTTAAATRT